ncbi:MAG: LysR family transcriptional regulator [Blautia sp.]|jgi:DNA-binding transcriptional LysR family regulator
MDISYELYKVFYYVATSLSFSKASEKLYISQSAVSQSIKTLERKLGHPLFDRSTKKVQLTSEGETLLRHVQPAILMIQQGEALFTEESPLKGQLRIGASDTICRYFLVPYLQRFHQEFPDVRIKITNKTSIGCVDLLEQGQVDFIVVNSPNSRLGKDRDYMVIGEFGDIFAANPQHFPLKDKILDLSDLQNYPILMLSQPSTTSEYLHRLFLSHKLTLVPEVELSSNDLLVDLARIGLGIAFLPDYMLPGNSSDLFPLKLREALPRRQLILAAQDLRPLSPAAQKFRDLFTAP